jgi:hypothetical protein
MVAMAAFTARSLAVFGSTFSVVGEGDGVEHAEMKTRRRKTDKKRERMEAILPQKSLAPRFGAHRL